MRGHYRYLYLNLSQGAPTVPKPRRSSPAIAMRDGPAAGLGQIEGLPAKRKLDNYPLARSAKAELCRRVGQMDEAKASKALALTSQEQQRRFLERRLAEMK